MSALGQKQTFAMQTGMSALAPIPTIKADSHERSCLVYPRKRTNAVQQRMSALPPQKRTCAVQPGDVRGQKPLVHGDWLLCDQAKHFCRYHAFRGRVQNGPLELPGGIGTMLLATRDNPSEGVPDAARSAIHRTAAVPKGRRGRCCFNGRAQLLPDILKLLEQGLAYTPRRVRPTGEDGRGRRAVFN